MAEAAFPFFRATFYRWLQLWPEVCDDLAKAPKVLAVGDLHIENFGTCRDLEGRLIWGVNDLDEVFPSAYTIDLVRLTTSAYLAIMEEHLRVARRDASEAVEEGYRDALAAGGKPFILAEDHQWLRLMALSKLRDPVHFWERITQLPSFTGKSPDEVRQLLEESLPSGSLYQLRKRIACTSVPHRPSRRSNVIWRKEKAAGYIRRPKGCAKPRWTIGKTGVRAGRSLRNRPTQMFLFA